MDGFNQNNNQQNQGFQQGQFVQQPFQQNQNAQQPYPQNQNAQQNGFQQNQFAQQPVNNQYYQPGTGQYVQPGMSAANIVSGGSKSKSVICMVFGILSTLFGLILGMVISRVMSTRHNTFFRYQMNGLGVFYIILEIIFLSLSIVFGIMSRSSKSGGKGMALAGFICSGVGVFFVILGLAGAFGV